MANKQAAYRKPSGLHKDQTLMLQRGRANYARLEERYQDLQRDHEHLREQYRELQLDYSHALARLWHLNSRQDARA